MNKKIIFGVIISIFALNCGLNTSASALDCVEPCPDVEGSVWAGSPEYSDEEDGIVTTSDDVSIKEVDLETEEVEEEPPMWPVYLSLGAIGVTFLLVIIISLTGRKYNKK